METVHFAHLLAPAPSTAYVAIVRGLRNAEAILDDVKRGARSFGDTPMALVDARLITSSTHIMVAVHQALLRNARSFEQGHGSAPSMRTKSVHSEILWNLSTTNNVAETFRTFGLSPSTTDLIVIHAAVAAHDGGPTAEQVSERIADICDGTLDQHGLASLDAWKRRGEGPSFVEPDWTAVVKAYRLADLRSPVQGGDLSPAELELKRKERLDAMTTSIVSMKFVAS